MIRFIALALLLPGCVTKVVTVKGPDGDQIHEATCHEHGQAPCLQRAADFCGGKYQVVSSDSETGIIMASGLAAPSTTNRLLFKCVEDDGSPKVVEEAPDTRFVAPWP